MTRAELQAQIEAYCDAGGEFSPEGLADHLWSNWQQVEILKQHKERRPQERIDWITAGVRRLNQKVAERQFRDALATDMAPYKTWDAVAMGSGMLTPRLLQVLALVAEGLQDHEIAARLGTSINTVHHQEASIRRKLGGLRNRAAMARWYVEHAGANTARV